EGAKSGGSWKDKKKAKVGAGFMATAPPGMNINLDILPKIVGNLNVQFR
ncbi:hypothetical protein Tco_1200158, partial [Tanacetum coccineum]